jgi:HD-GYP domain-containing protein (c-di-GMP phosphodiesterase class II)
MKKQHIRRYAVLVLAQGACLALGLWLEHRFVSFANRSAAESFQAAANDSTPARDGGAAAPCSNQSDAATNEVPAAAIAAIAFIWIAALQAGAAWLVLSQAQEADLRKQTKTESVSLQRYNDLLRTRDAVIFALAKLAESRDSDTGNHLERIAIYSTRLASALRRKSPYRNQISAQFLQLIGVSSSLHDIGKVGIADSILMKPGKFIEEERLMMQLHVAIGGKCAQDIETRLGQSNFLQMAREIALCHHERWDGRGYPEGLAGEEIPLSARIVAVADVYDALSTKRVYKDAIPHRQCVEMIRHESGRHFDPAIVDVFLAIEAEFEAIVARCTEPRDANAAGPAALERAGDAPGKGDRFDDDLSLAMELLDQWAAESPASSGTSPRRETHAERSSDARREHVPAGAEPASELSTLEKVLADVS